MDKDLLLIDLCPRVPYGIKIQINSTVKIVRGIKDDYIITKERGLYCDKEYITRIECCKPYLRPMSSMTEEEKREYNLFFFGAEPLTCDFSVYAVEHRTLYEFDAKKLIDWLNKHYFDYRGLIKKGLALEAKEGMYKIE